MLDLPRFDHEAMKTTFSVRVVGCDESVGRGLARECFDLLDYIEDRLSRFVEGSDVWQINHMKAGETLYLSEPGDECLRIALEMCARTGGLFDVTLGSRIEHLKAGESGSPPAARGRLALQPDAPAIVCDEPGREIDLGGIGKGYALDRMLGLLVDWGAEGALLGAGASTILAHGAGSWPVDLSGGSAKQRIELCGLALGASGTMAQGNHIVDPRAAGPDESPRRPGTWVLADTAAVADAFSTAVMLMDEDELSAFLAADESLIAVYVDDGVEVRAV